MVSSNNITIDNNIFLANVLQSCIYFFAETFIIQGLKRNSVYRIASSSEILNCMNTILKKICVYFSDVL